jgi:hypothetical protein
VQTPAENGGKPAKNGGECPIIGHSLTIVMKGVTNLQGHPTSCNSEPHRLSPTGKSHRTAANSPPLGRAGARTDGAPASQSHTSLAQGRFRCMYLLAGGWDSALRVGRLGLSLRVMPARGSNFRQSSRIVARSSGQSFESCSFHIPPEGWYRFRSHGPGLWARGASARRRIRCRPGNLYREPTAWNRS